MPHSFSFTKIDNEFLDHAMKHMRTHSELACCLVIFRKTVGWGKKSEKISYQEFYDLTGIRNKKTIIAAIKSLEKKGLIRTRKSSGKPTSYTYKKAVPTTGTGTNKYQYQKTVPVVVPITGTGLLYKEKERKEREGELLISEEYKQKFIQSTMVGEDIKNRQGYELSMRKKLLKNDPATLEMYGNWKESYEKEKIFADFRSNYIGKRLEVKINDEVLSGEIKSITREDDKFVVAITDGDSYKSIRYKDLISLQKTIETAA